VPATGGSLAKQIDLDEDFVLSDDGGKLSGGDLNKFFLGLRGDDAGVGGLLKGAWFHLSRELVKLHDQD